ncbi:unnamed protein product [Lampetra planeri]
MTYSVYDSILSIPTRCRHSPHARVARLPPKVTTTTTHTTATCSSSSGTATATSTTVTSTTITTTSTTGIQQTKITSCRHHGGRLLKRRRAAEPRRLRGHRPGGGGGPEVTTMKTNATALDDHSETGTSAAPHLRSPPSPSLDESSRTDRFVDGQSEPDSADERHGMSTRLLGAVVRRQSTRSQGCVRPMGISMTSQI